MADFASAPIYKPRLRKANLVAHFWRGSYIQCGSSCRTEKYADRRHLSIRNSLLGNDVEINCEKIKDFAAKMLEKFTAEVMSTELQTSHKAGTAFAKRTLGGSGGIAVVYTGDLRFVAALDSFNPALGDEPSSIPPLM